MVMIVKLQSVGTKFAIYNLIRIANENAELKGEFQMKTHYPNRPRCVLLGSTAKEFSSPSALVPLRARYKWLTSEPRGPPPAEMRSIRPVSIKAATGQIGCNDFSIKLCSLLT